MHGHKHSPSVSLLLNTHQSEKTLTAQKWRDSRLSLRNCSGLNLSVVYNPTGIWHNLRALSCEKWENTDRIWWPMWKKTLFFTCLNICIYSSALKLSEPSLETEQLTLFVRLTIKRRSDWPLRLELQIETSWILLLQCVFILIKHRFPPVLYKTTGTL